jgi:hypothetical protein
MQSLVQGRNRFMVTAIIAAGLIGLTMVAFPAQLSNAQAAPSAAIKQLTMNGGEENPPLTVKSIGYFSGTLTDGQLEFDLSADGGQFTQAHIHQGAKGVNGPVVAFLFGPANPPVGALHPTGVINKASLVGPLAGNWDGFVAAMAKGELYVNAHTVANPGGEVRAQIPPTTLVPAPPKAGNSNTVADGSSMTQVAGGVLVTFAAVALAVTMVRRRRSA